MTFKHYADLYLKFGKTEWKLSTYCKNKGIVKNRLNVFFDYDIDKINASMIKEFICSIDDVGLKSKKHYISSLSSIFKLALDDEVINKNPLIHLKTIKAFKKEIEPFNADEVHAILNLAKLHQ
ncbi:tyrosine-type recombinase/integrase, partial [Campylobacter majalis]